MQLKRVLFLKKKKKVTFNDKYLRTKCSTEKSEEEEKRNAYISM